MTIYVSSSMLDIWLLSKYVFDWSKQNTCSKFTKETPEKYLKFKVSISSLRLTYRYFYDVDVSLQNKFSKSKNIVSKFSLNLMIIERLLLTMQGQCSYHKEASYLICYANPLTSFYIIKTSALTGLTLTLSNYHDLKFHF